MAKPWVADALATPIHAAEKTRPLQRKSLQGAANVILRQKIADRFASRSWPADVLPIVLALLVLNVCWPGIVSGRGAA
ncbi:hypothetical protein GCM10011400_49440 [Paraburkholderia caffeinilytica]|uniref:Uncharacterized protein n=1 Tax=Paraburkholderia caffeinilytica TaxID=1761016 RepID=A0ABQ1N6Q4_9BURK|nr:hypothetical protein GCM10011400_49440 [Paraburkholderia caffeinilytica]